jgi:hypothetical protein
MEKSTIEQNKMKRRTDCLENHARLHKLFSEDRLSFERERKRMIDEAINSVKDKNQRDRMRALQESWDTEMKYVGSEDQRLALAQHLFWKHINEVWAPSLEQYNSQLNEISGKRIP